MRARSALFTLFGDVVLPAGGEAWLSTITACMATLGFRSQAVRTALHRMAVEGWVEPRREGRYAAYRLTARGVDRLEEAAARIYRLRSLDWDGTWRLVLAPDLRDAEVVAELEWIGYGRVQDGVWAHPHPHPDTAKALLARAGVEATWVEGASVDDDRAFAGGAWALEALRDAHRDFLDEWTDVDVPTDPDERFALRLRLVHRWRRFLFLDPGLPAEVLPADWPGYTAAQVFARTYESLREPTWAHYAELQAGAGPSPSPTGRIEESASPFAQGLAALGQD
ncbi:PaaX family transcriptional regulator C-terminal domain-containing protein [Euzebya sp.]|uniref:PaaX family transcriptional regulator n=1 Tax=Euzebya sp. TaxID=1971409 RepID=UPI00351176B4